MVLAARWRWRWTFSSRRSLRDCSGTVRAQRSPEVEGETPTHIGSERERKAGEEEGETERDGMSQVPQGMAEPRSPPTPPPCAPCPCPCWESRRPRSTAPRARRVPSPHLPAPGVRLEEQHRPLHLLVPVLLLQEGVWGRQGEQGGSHLGTVPPCPAWASLSRLAPGGADCSPLPYRPFSG